MRLNHIMIGSFIILGFIFWACKKGASEVNANPSDVEIAKEWWYGNFRKSTNYNYINYSSPLSPLENSSSKKYPNWPEAVSYSQKGFSITEVPLYFITNNVILPGMKDLPMPEASRIAKSVIHKLLIVKMPNGNTVVRIASLIPSAEYARANNYDISKLHPLKLPSDFNGHMSITDWAMGLKKFFKVRNGKMVANLNMFKKGVLPKRRNEKSVLGRMVCPTPYDEPNMVWVCVVIPVGDQLAPGEGCEPNGPNGYWTEQGTVTVYPECYDDGEDEDGTGDGDLFNCLQTGTPADCYCEFLGTGCEGEGEGDDEFDEEAEAEIVAQVFSIESSPKAESIAFTSATTSGVPFQWVIVKNTLDLWQVNSSDVAIGYNSANTGAILFDIEHTGSNFSGQNGWNRVPRRPGGFAPSLVSLSWGETSNSKSIASNYKSGTVTVSGNIKNFGQNFNSYTQSCTITVH